MSKKDELLALAERCERTSGPDKHLNLAIADAIYGDKLAPAGASYNYTASIDAAMTLVPDRHMWSVGSDGPDDGPWACVTNEDDEDWSSHATIPELAVCAAVLRARAAMEA